MLTTTVLLRLRHKLTVHGRRQRLLLAEETAALAFEGTQTEPTLLGDAAYELLGQPSSGDLAPVARSRLLAHASERVSTALPATIAAFANERADALAEDHARVRAALPGVSRVSVEPALPVDVIGLYLLMPGGA